MILSVKNVSLSFGDNEVLRDVTFQVNENERVALVGPNGCGKTTLLGVITGELFGGGDVALKNGATVGYQKQASALHPDRTIKDEMKTAGGADELLLRIKELEATMGGDPSLIAEYERATARYEAMDGYNLDFNINKVLNGLGFPKKEHGKLVGVLSGGERTRLALAKLLVSKPDLLILDEPTNHLDIDTLEWLERFLLDYSGALLTVSHDRHFLDAVATRVIELRNGKSRVYSGNYSAFLRQRDAEEQSELRAYEKTAEYAAKLEDYAKRNIVRASTSNMAKSRLKMLGSLDLTPPELAKHARVSFEIVPSGEPFKEVLTLSGVSAAAGGKTLIQDLDFVLRRGERLGIVGANGAGKTTLLRVITGKARPAAGRVKTGGGVRASVLEQNPPKITSKNPLEFIWDRYPAMDQLGVRSLLASVGFRGDEVFTDAAALSGGELMRLHLARISLERPNLLILDEPTNHLDIYTKDILYDALKSYAGALVVVTHDRYLVELLGGAVLRLDGNGKYTLYESWAQYCGERGAAPPDTKEKPPQPERAAEGLNQREQRRARAEDRQRRAELEKRIDELEKEEFYVTEEMNEPAVKSDHEKLWALSERLDEIKDELNRLSDEWLENYSD